MECKIVEAVSVAIDNLPVGCDVEDVEISIEKKVGKITFRRFENGLKISYLTGIVEYNYSYESFSFHCY